MILIPKSINSKKNNSKKIKKHQLKSNSHQFATSTISFGKDDDGYHFISDFDDDLTQDDVTENGEQHPVDQNGDGDDDATEKGDDQDDDQDYDQDDDQDYDQDDDQDDDLLKLF